MRSSPRNSVPTTYLPACSVCSLFSVRCSVCFLARHRYECLNISDGCCLLHLTVENHEATSSANSAGIKQPLMQQDAPTNSNGVDRYCADVAFALLMSMNSVSIMVVSIAHAHACRLLTCFVLLDAPSLPVDDATVHLDCGLPRCSTAVHCLCPTLLRHR